MRWELTTHVLAHFHVKVAIQAPAITPWVLNDPVRSPTFINAIPHRKDSMIHILPSHDIIRTDFLYTWYHVRAYVYVYVYAYVHHMHCVSLSALHALRVRVCVYACAWAVDVPLPMHLHVCMFICHSSQQKRHDSHSAIIDINGTCSLYTYVHVYACYNYPFYTNVSACHNSIHIWFCFQPCHSLQPRAQYVYAYTIYVVHMHMHMRYIVNPPDT